MFKSSRQNSAKQNSEGSEKQKHKKRLSFKEPEVENRGSRKEPEPEPSLEDLKLEDQALLIARNVGFAFVKPSQKKASNLQLTTGQSIKDSGKPSSGEDPLLESGQPKSKTEQLSFPLSQDQGYLEALSPIKPGPTAMRCPDVQFAPDTAVRNTALVSEQQQPRLPTAAHHQIQLLCYQLEQQRQQTQSAMYQIQLLKDQLEAESAARYKAQVHNHHLMVQNKELLDHIQRLFQQVQDLEKKMEFHERKSALPASSQEPKQAFLGMQGCSTLGSRRNSSGSQSLWSSTPSLNPISQNGSRHASSTSLAPQQEAKPSEAPPRRLSISRDETTSRYHNSYETDWRYRRRGSSSNFSSTTSLTVGRASNLSSGLTAGDAPKSPTTSLPIPELRLSDVDSRQESTSEGENRFLKEKLLIRDPLRKDRSPSPKDPESASRAFKPTSTETPSYFSKPNKATELSVSDTEMSPKKSNKTFGSLRLFNS